MRRKNDFMLQEVAGQDLLVPLGPRIVDLNGIVALNGTGSYVWELLAEDRTVDHLATAVSNRFDVDPERARSDVQIFLNEIGRLGLLENDVPSP